MILPGVFVVLSVLLLVFTLSRPHRHRFYRFFAFESLLGLVILNAVYWFQRPFSVLQLISWVFLVASFLLALHGFRLLQGLGSPSGDIEDTTRLVTVGAYGYIRHPLYASLLLCGAGAFLKRISIPSFFLLIVLLVFIYATARVEERDNLHKFGEPYREYMANTKMFIPFLL